MKRNLILIGSAILLSVGSWVYANNVKIANAAAQEQALSQVKKSECCASSKTTADAAKSCCEQKK